MELTNHKKRNEPFRKVRNINITYSSIRSRIPCEKSIIDGFVEAESLIEAGFYDLLIHDPNCIDLESQPVEIPAEAEDEGGPYIPDTWAKFKDGIQYLFDVKTQDYLDSLKKNDELNIKWVRRVRYIEKFCQNNDLKYMITTDKEIFGVRYKNVEFFKKNERRPDTLDLVRREIETIFDDAGGMRRIDFANRIARENKTSVGSIIPAIDHLIYLDYFDLDFEEIINDRTLLIPRKTEKTSIVPIYEYILKTKNNLSTSRNIREISLDRAEKDPNHDDLSRREFNSLSERIQKTILDKIKVLEIVHDVGLNSDDFQRLTAEKKISISTLYRWKKAFDTSGWIGLIPRNTNAGRRRVTDPTLDITVRKIIEQKYLQASEPSMMSAYRFLCIECKRNNLTPPHYSTFCRRIKELNEETKTICRRGRKASRDKFKSLYGQSSHINYPLARVEIDHTILDVVLVDRFDRKPIGRPKLTIAVDVDSRMVFGYYLSFDAPDLLAVGMCLLNGILPKEECTAKFNTKNSWPIHGLPKSILLDNAKEFRSSGLARFCMLYAITMEFCPVKKPETKPHVERFIRTINETIRDDLIGGYTVPLAEKRLTGYDPETHAELTIDEFEEWLVQWIVDDYHQRIHAGIQQKEGVEASPQEWYEKRLMNTGGSIVGVPNTPINPEQLKFDVLPFEERALQRGGIKIWGLEYNAPVVAKIRSESSRTEKKHVVKYDPRDIREVYLWIESEKMYEKIPLKNVYMEQLRINPTDSENIPLSLHEFEQIKGSISKKIKIPQHTLVEARLKRQEFLETTRNKRKCAKKRRKEVENRDLHKRNATSFKIRDKAINQEEIMTLEEFQPEIQFINENEPEEETYPNIMPVRNYNDENDDEDEQ